MNYDEFLECIKNMVTDIIQEKSSVEINTIVKNNGKSYNGLTINPEDINISPTIYVNNYYMEYIQGRNIENIVQEIMELYNSSKFGEKIKLDFFTNFQKASKNIVFKLINFEKNENQLKEIPYIKFRDLAIVFYYLVDREELKNATIQIKNSHLKLWNISLEQLYQISKENTPKLLPYELKNMEEILNEMIIEEYDTDNDFIFDNDNFSMYVLTNKIKQNGAACILYKDILREFSKKIGNDLYILPSSVHEVILVPARPKDEYYELSQMVIEVNTTNVKDEEVLSDHVYYYSMEKDTIE